MNNVALPTRQRLLEQIEQLARHAIHGTLSEATALVASALPLSRSRPRARTALIHQLPRERGKTSGYYVPKAAESEVRRGVEAWSQLQTLLRQLSALNKEAPSKPLASKNRRTFATGFS